MACLAAVPSECAHKYSWRILWSRLLIFYHFLALRTTLPNASTLNLHCVANIDIHFSTIQHFEVILRSLLSVIRKETSVNPARIFLLIAAPHLKKRWKNFLWHVLCAKRSCLQHSLFSIKPVCNLSGVTQNVLISEIFFYDRVCIHWLIHFKMACNIPFFLNQQFQFASKGKV